MKTRNTLKIDITNKSFSFQNVPEMHSYLGGQGVSSFLLNKHLSSSVKDFSYFSIVTGPLNGVFPYTSKSIITSLDNRLNIDYYIGGGRIGSLLNFSTLDAIEIIGRSEVPLYLEITGKSVRFLELSDSHNLDGLGLSGRRSKIEISTDIVADDYFSFGTLREDRYVENNVKGIVYSPEAEYTIPELFHYSEVLEKVKSREKSLLVVRGTSPSCFGCPMGCAFSKNPEQQNVSILPRSLISCAFAEPIYNDINLVFSCLSSLGYEYTHEFLETFSKRIGELNRDIHEKVEGLKEERHSITKIS